MRSRWLRSFVAVFVVAAVTYWTLGGPLQAWLGLGASGYWLLALLVAGVVALLSRGNAAVRGPGDDDDRYVRRGEFLCDSCRYNSARDCRLPDRPNAAACGDYRSR